MQGQAARGWRAEWPVCATRYVRARTQAIARLARRVTSLTSANTLKALTEGHSVEVGMRVALQATIQGLTQDKQDRDWRSSSNKGRELTVAQCTHNTEVSSKPMTRCDMTFAGAPHSLQCIGTASGACGRCLTLPRDTSRAHCHTSHRGRRGLNPDLTVRVSCTTAHTH